MFQKKKNLLFNEKVKVTKDKVKSFSNKNRTCLLDMRAEKSLSKNDLELFDCFLFGGILGDVPPKDRTKELRDQEYEIRKIGVNQLPTDTAVLATKLILEGLNYEDINFIDDPEIPIDNIKPGSIYDCLSDFYLSDIDNFKQNLNKYPKIFNEDQINSLMKSFDLDEFIKIIKSKLTPNTSNTNSNDFKKIKAYDYQEIYSMNGFRYICDDYFSWSLDKKSIFNFPLISPGMFRIWKNYLSDPII